MILDPLQLLAWQDRLLNVRRNWEPTWQDIADFIIPNKTGITTRNTPGTKQTTKLFDSTGNRALKRLSAVVHGSLTSSTIKWFNLRMRDERLNKSRAVKLWLEDTTSRMTSQINASNFNSECQEVYIDLTGFATAALFVEEAAVKDMKGFPGITNTALPCGSYVIDEGPDGLVDTLFRDFPLSAINIVKKFGDKVPDEIAKAAKEKPDTPFDVVHAIYPREGGKSTPTTPARDLSWASVHVSKKHKVALSEGGFHEFPVMVPRWSKCSGETYGRGPGHEVIPDVKTLNKAIELSLKAFGKAIDPPMTALHDGIVGGDVRLMAGGITYVTDKDALRPVELGSKWDVVKFKTEDIRDAVNKSFLADHITLKDSPAMTAEEVRTRSEMMIKLLGPTLGRIETELLNPFIQRVFNMMLRAKAIDAPPAEVLEAMANARGQIDIEYTGPLAKGQRIQEVYAIERIYQFITPIATVSPGVLDILDHDENVRAACDVLGMPVKGVREDKVVKKIRADRGAAEADAAKVDADRQDAGTVKDLAAAENKNPQGAPFPPGIPGTEVGSFGGESPQA